MSSTGSVTDFGGNAPAGDRVTGGTVGIARIVRRVFDVVDHEGISDGEDIRQCHGDQPPIEPNVMRASSEQRTDDCQWNDKRDVFFPAG